MRRLMIPLLVLVLINSAFGAEAQAKGPGVKPLGLFPLGLPGLPVSPDARPNVFLWCHGARLLGVVVPGERRERTGTAGQGLPMPDAFLLRDGRCEAEGGGVSFGFLVPVKAWVFASAARTPPEERTAWLLHRFEGTLNAGVLRGVLIQVDVNHPGYAFRESKVEVDTVPEDQAPFADEKVWRDSVARKFNLEFGGP